MYVVVVVGGGASGMMAAGRAAECGNQVTLLEKNEKLGKKIYITGKGRCNVTNADISAFEHAVVNNYRFLLSAFNNFNSHDTVEFLARYGVQTKIERGRRVFPASDKASDITKAFERYMREFGVNIVTEAKVNSLIVKDNAIAAVDYSTSEKKRIVLPCDYAIIATGGLSYRATGSDGDGYTIATKLGHSLIAPRPALVGIELYENVADLAGVTLKNIDFRVVRGNVTLYREFGETLFTHSGISGPIVLTASSRINNENLDGAYAVFDLKPRLSESELDVRIIKDFDNNKNKLLKNALDDLLIRSLQPYVLAASGVSGDVPVNSISRKQRSALAGAIKGLKFRIKSLGDINTAIVTAGGISTKEINPKSMESKLIRGLKFAGEVIDVDALTGGFNLQIAFSTGYAAGTIET